MTLPTFRAALTGLACVVTLAACGGEEDKPTGAIAVEAKDDACAVTRTEADAGTITFEVNNKGSQVTEFYLYAEGGRVMGEAENIEPGKSRRLNVEVSAGGKYQTACKPGMKGDGIRADFTVKGGAAKQADGDAALAEATKGYHRYVVSQSDTLLVKTKEFVDAVKAAKVDEAKALFPVARTYWERIEPVAESFGDLDPRIDAREADLEPGAEFTGFHRLEKDLWVSGPQADSAAIADRLMADVTEVVDRSKKIELTPLQLANGAKELLDEVATGKITGEEDIFSHTDLWDFRANVDGSQAAVAALRPIVEKKDPALAKTLDERFKAVDTLLEAQRDGSGFKSYDKLTESEIKAFAEAVDALGEPISKVADVVAAK
ncbi:MAG TPA: iron uptake system protein EfeO [Actinokineospora sp.]|nr:iron uptake system protein EfeO [Actinokineospora sp.]